MQNSNNSNDSNPLSRRYADATERLSGINAVLSDHKIPATQRTILAATIAYMVVMLALVLKAYSEGICLIVTFAYLVCVTSLYIVGRSFKS